MEPTRYRFYKVTKPESEYNGRWFIDYPEWDGDPDDLEMVSGADTMLEYLSDKEDFVYLTISDKDFDSDFTLQFLYECAHGGMYDYRDGKEDGFEIWLCKVTYFVFGYLPETIYCKKD